MLGAASGAIAGLVAVTPACGYIGPMGAIVLGLLVSPLCFTFVTKVKTMMGYDDSLDVFGVHCVGGIFGALSTGILVNPALGGTGVYDYVANAVAPYDMAAQWETGNAICGYPQSFWPDGFSSNPKWYCRISSGSVNVTSSRPSLSSHLCGLANRPRP